MGTRHFLSLDDLHRNELLAIVQRAMALKNQQTSRPVAESLRGRTLAMIFEKASTRTRLSFEAGMAQLGGHAIYLSPENMQLSRGESIKDTARVLSKMVDAVVIRALSHKKIEEFCSAASVPVINGLSEMYHPCQLLADIQTYTEHRGTIKDKKVAWLGDGNNMCHSYINAARLFGFALHIACPQGYLPNQKIVASANNWVKVFHRPADAVKDADLVVTDVWTSMGDETESRTRIKIFNGFQVNAALMALANKEAVFMHCLPAHRGEEVSAEVIDGEQSLVWDEAGNRLHAQKALLEFLILGKLAE